MAEAAAARREARRRRILDNSNNRLQLIAGKVDNETPRESPVRYTTPEQSNEIPHVAECISTNKSSLNNGALVGEPELLPVEAREEHEHNTSVAGDGDLPSILASLPDLSFLSQIQAPAPEPVAAPTQSLLEKIIVNKYDIVFLSLFIQFIYGVMSLSLENTYVFVPFIVYVVTKLIFFPVKTNSKITNALLLLNQLSRRPNGVDKLLYILQWTGLIFQDISVYLFTIICVQSLCNTIKENYIT